jgi:hypothetical protein
MLREDNVGPPIRFLSGRARPFRGKGFTLAHAARARRLGKKRQLGRDQCSGPIYAPKVSDGKRPRRGIGAQGPPTLWEVFFRRAWGAGTGSTDSTRRSCEGSNLPAKNNDCFRWLIFRRADRQNPLQENIPVLVPAFDFQKSFYLSYRGRRPRTPHPAVRPIAWQSATVQNVTLAPRRLSASTD